MAERDTFDERRRGLEEEYFHRKERELVEQLRRRAEEEADRSGMAETSGIADEEILRSLQDIGFTRETVALLHLVPLVRVAWIDGGMTSHERDLFLEIAASRGVAAGSEAHARLLDWLSRRPSEDFFDASMGVIRAILDAQSEVGGTTAADIVALCKQVASASGGLLGFGRKISDAERELIERIAGEIAQEKPEGAQRVIEEI